MNTTSLAGGGQATGGGDGPWWWWLPGANWWGVPVCQTFGKFTWSRRTLLQRML